MDRKTGKLSQIEVKSGTATRSISQLSRDAEIKLDGLENETSTTWGMKKVNEKAGGTQEKIIKSTIFALNDSHFMLKN
ncbi:TPA: hypothetical protein JGU28_004579 [Salmonella enterica]|nr:hypothetical protein [Salmonella enterica]